MTPTPAAWHVLRTRAGSEMRVATEILETLTLPVYCPRYRVTYVTRNRRRTALVPFLRTYVFARWPADDARVWHALTALTGVVAILGTDRPAPVPESHLARIHALIGDDDHLLDLGDDPRLAAHPRPARTHRPGDRVRITLGPFRGYDGVVDSTHPRHPLINVVIGGLLSRDAIVPIPTTDVEPLEPATPGPRSACGAMTRPSRVRRRGHRGGEPTKRADRHRATSVTLATPA